MRDYKYKGETFKLDDSNGCYVKVTYKDLTGSFGYCQVNSPPSTMPGCTLAGPATFGIAFRPTSSAMPSGSTTDTA